MCNRHFQKLSFPSDQVLTVRKEAEAPSSTERRPDRTAEAGAEAGSLGGREMLRLRRRGPTAGAELGPAGGGAQGSPIWLLDASSPRQPRGSGRSCSCFPLARAGRGKEETESQLQSRLRLWPSSRTSSIGLDSLPRPSPSIATPSLPPPLTILP